jgi:hypothetical protein
MPRRMPRFDNLLSMQAQSAVAIVKAGEIAHASGGPSIRKEWTVIRLEALYELAYLRVFAAWETCLESIFLRSLCGYASKAGQETLVTGSYFPTLSAAEAAVLSGQSYSLWHSPQKVIGRCQRFIRAGTGFPAVQQAIISSNFTRLEDLAFTRHRVVHDQADAKNKFDAATLRIAGRAYPSSRPGRFLRDWDASTSPPQRWLDTVVAELVKFANQMV